MQTIAVSVFPGLGGALGYMLGGLDWTDTALGRAFKSQEQILFLFAGVTFIISVTLHMLSIPERRCASSNMLKDTEDDESSSQSSSRHVANTTPFLDIIAEEDAYASSRDDKEAHLEERELDFLAAEKVRSKSDSVLAMPDATIDLDPDLDLDRPVFLPAEHFLPETHEDLENAFRPSDPSVGSSSPPGDLPSVTNGIVVVEPATVLPQPKDPTNSQPCIPQTSSASVDAHQRQVELCAINVLISVY